VVFAKSGTWWVQPVSNKPFTAIRQDSTWETETHMGTEYAALLVDPEYWPPKTTDVLPGRGKGVVAVATIEGTPPAEKVPKRIYFSGYEWEVLQLPTDSAGVSHANSTSNVWTDSRGQLHLRISREGEEWKCAEVKLTRSLGYGKYTFQVQRTPTLEPGTVFGMFTWDDMEAGQNHREIDIELSQWGDPTVKNAQFALQPYYVAANVFRFIAPSAPLRYSFDWELGRVALRADHATGERSVGVVAEHVFTAGVPSPGGETVRINLYIYGKSRTPQRHGVEVVIDKFEFLP
jgi:hypothetical protein